MQILGKGMESEIFARGTRRYTRMGRLILSACGWRKVSRLRDVYGLSFFQEVLIELRDMTAPIPHPRDPLNGITLEHIVKQLVQKHGWSEMGRRIPVRCFQLNPSVKSSLTFLRKTPWARKRVEEWFVGER